MSEVENTSFEDCLQRLMVSLEASLYEEATSQLAGLHSGEIARLLEAFLQKKGASFGKALILPHKVMFLKSSVKTFKSSY